MKENNKKPEQKNTIDTSSWLDAPVQKIPLNNKNVFNIKSPKNTSAIKDLVKNTPGIQTDVKDKVSNHFTKASRTKSNLPDLSTIDLSRPFSPKKQLEDFGGALGSPEPLTTNKKSRLNRNVFENPIYRSS